MRWWTWSGGDGRGRGFDGHGRGGDNTDKYRGQGISFISMVAESFVETSTLQSWWLYINAVKPFEYQDKLEGTWTEPKFYYVEFGRTAIPTSNGHISETKRDFLDPLVPKFSYDRGLSPTLSWKWPSATLSPSFGLFQSEKPLFWDVSVTVCLWSKYAPGPMFGEGRKKITWHPILWLAV